MTEQRDGKTWFMDFFAKQGPPTRPGLYISRLLYEKDSYVVKATAVFVLLLFAATLNHPYPHQTLTSLKSG